MHASAGLHFALGVALIATPLGQRHEFFRIGCIVKTHAAQTGLFDIAVDQQRVVVFAVRPLRRGERRLRAAPGHQYPLAELVVVGELQLTAEKRIAAQQHRLERVGHLDYIALLENKTPFADGHHLHLAAAMLALAVVRQHIGVLAIHIAVEVLQRGRTRRRMAIGTGGARERDAASGCTGFYEITPEFVNVHFFSAPF